MSLKQDSGLSIIVAGTTWLVLLAAHIVSCCLLGKRTANRSLQEVCDGGKYFLQEEKKLQTKERHVSYATLNVHIWILVRIRSIQKNILDLGIS
jgi:hypothetical protein